MKNLKIAIIGGGNLGGAIARGLVAGKLIQPSNITVTRRRISLIADLGELGIRLETDNVKAVSQADIVMFAIKPYQLESVVKEIAPSLKQDAMLLSLATGISSQQISAYCNKPVAIFRAMPNTAIAIGESMTCISAFNATKEQENLMLDIFNQMGKALIIAEDLMASATVLAACGIAYALRFIRAATQGGIEIGFGSEMALQIAAQTVKGAAELIIQNGSHPEAEIDKVTTPRGITISGLNEMEHQGFSSSLIKGLVTSFNKIENGK
jgi:pyrroline-5-carboxylate reductase